MSKDFDHKEEYFADGLNLEMARKFRFHTDEIGLKLQTLVNEALAGGADPKKVSKQKGLVEKLKDKHIKAHADAENAFEEQLRINRMKIMLGGDGKTSFGTQAQKDQALFNANRLHSNACGDITKTNSSLSSIDPSLSGHR